MVHKNSLRMYRKSSPLNQSDVAFLLQLPDYSNISRWENGLRTPNTEVLFVYHLLFGAPLENLLDQHTGDMNRVLKERINMLLTELHGLRQSQKVAKRIAFLETVIMKISE